MSADQEVINLAGAESESQTLFDEPAGLVPPERQAEYCRVIAHTRTLSPNDEVLRVLEAMGILALLMAAKRTLLTALARNGLTMAKRGDRAERVL